MARKAFFGGLANPSQIPNNIINVLVSGHIDISEISIEPSMILQTMHFFILQKLFLEPM